MIEALRYIGFGAVVFVSLALAWGLISGIRTARLERLRERALELAIRRHLEKKAATATHEEVDRGD